jgi:hypothetical protein
MIENLIITVSGLIAVLTVLVVVGFIAEKRGWE